VCHGGWRQLQRPLPCIGSNLTIVNQIIDKELNNSVAYR